MQSFSSTNISSCHFILPILLRFDTKCVVAIDRGPSMRLHRLHIRERAGLLDRIESSSADDVMKMHSLLHMSSSVYAMPQPPMPFGKHEPEPHDDVDGQLQFKNSNLCARTCFAVPYLITAAVCQHTRDAVRHPLLRNEALSQAIYWRTNFATTASTTLKSMNYLQTFLSVTVTRSDTQRGKYFAFDDTLSSCGTRNA